MKRDPHQELLNVDLGPYGGEWVAIYDSKVISHGKRFKDVFYSAKKKCHGKIPYLAKVPGNEAWLF